MDKNKTLKLPLKVKRTYSRSINYTDVSIIDGENNIIINKGTYSKSIADYYEKLFTEMVDMINNFSIYKQLLESIMEIKNKNMEEEYWIEYADQAVGFNNLMDILRYAIDQVLNKNKKVEDILYYFNK